MLVFVSLFVSFSLFLSPSRKEYSATLRISAQNGSSLALPIGTKPAASNVSLRSAQSASSLCPMVLAFCSRVGPFSPVICLLLFLLLLNGYIPCLCARSTSDLLGTKSVHCVYVCVWLIAALLTTKLCTLCQAREATHLFLSSTSPLPPLALSLSRSRSATLNNFSSPSTSGSLIGWR